MNNISNEVISDTIQSMLANYGLDYPDIEDYYVYRDKLQCVQNMKIPPMPLKLEPFSIILEADNTPSNSIGNAENLRTLILQMMEMEIDVVRSMINDTTQIKKAARNKIIELYDASMKNLEDLIVNLTRRLLVNFQPEIKRIVEYFLIMYTLKTEPSLMADLAEESERSLIALLDVIGPKTDSAFQSIFVRHLLPDLAQKIENDLGIMIDLANFDNIGSFNVICMIQDELSFANELLVVKGFLHELVTSQCQFEEGDEIVIQVSPAKGEQPLACFPGLYRGYSVLLKSTGLVDVFYASIIRNRSDDVALQTVVIKDGLFHDEAHLGHQSESTVVSILNNILHLDDMVIKGMRKTVKYLAYLYDDLFTPSSSRKEVVKMIESITSIEGKLTLEFIPAKDESLYFRARAGKDCSINLDCHVTHPRSCFYKIIMLGKWIGYVTLHDVCDRYSRKAILIDVFNMRQDPHANFIDIYEKFIDELAKQLGPQGYEYILLPPQMELVSNHEFIKRPVFRQYYNNIKVAGFSLTPFEEKFHSTGASSFIVVSDFTDCCQLLMFGE